MEDTAVAEQTEEFNCVVEKAKDGEHKSGVLVVLDGDASTRSDNGSLQESFKKFRSQKIKERQLIKASQTNPPGERTEAFKDGLRQKFIDTAKRYLGVPYAERYKAESDPVAPLYLDCCGLIRQSLQDLQEDFGFVVGRWNQAYQIDTLPVVLTKEQLKPGDLIFYEGKYNSSRSKPQKHDMVHVEIYLGGETGNATLGARFHRGVVSIFDSYEFKSTTWELVQYHYRSIDTWLNGECKSHCPCHPWNNDSLAYVEAAGKRSIFADEAGDDDINAGGDEDVQEAAAAAAEGQDVFPPNDDDEISIGAHSVGMGFGRDDLCVSCNFEGEPDLPPATPTPQDVANSDLLPPKPSEPAAVEGEGASESQSTKAKRPKRVSALRSSGEQSLQTSQSAPAVGVRTSRSSKESQAAHTYFVGKANGWKLVKAALDKRGWQELPVEFKNSTRFGLKWVELRSDIDYRSHNPGQLVCHIPNNDCITTKIGLLSTLKSKYCKSSNNVSANDQHVAVPWLPETFDIGCPADVQALMQHVTNVGENPSNPSGVWIYKPSSNNRGRGIKVIKGIDAVKEAVKPADATIPVKGIVQRYIENPLLVGPNGHKFDLRCYMLIARTHPKTIALYHPGYCRLSLKPFTLDSLSDNSIHLTNASVQKKEGEYDGLKEFQIQSVAAIADNMEQQGKPESANYIRTQLDKDIMACMVDVLKASNDILQKKHGYFDLLGCDFMLTADNKLHLLEINTNPALSRDNSTLENLLPAVVDGALELVLGLQGPDRSSEVGAKDKLLSALPGQYQLLFDEETGFFFGGNDATRVVDEKLAQEKPSWLQA